MTAGYEQQQSVVVSCTGVWCVHMWRPVRMIPPSLPPSSHPTPLPSALHRYSVPGKFWQTNGAAVRSEKVKREELTWPSLPSPSPPSSGMISSTILSSRTGGPTSTCLSRQSSSTDRSQVNTGFLIGLQITERLAQTEIISVWYRNCVILPHMNFPTSTESQYLQQFNSRDLTEYKLFLFFLSLSLCYYHAHLWTGILTL